MSRSSCQLSTAVTRGTKSTNRYGADKLYARVGGVPPDCEPRARRRLFVQGSNGRDGLTVSVPPPPRNHTTAILDPSPTVADGVVYIAASYPAQLFALDATSGAVLWETKLGNNGLEGSPRVADGMVFVAGDDGNLYALSTSDGSVVWKTPTIDRVSTGDVAARIDDAGEVAVGVVAVGGLLAQRRRRTGEPVVGVVGRGGRVVQRVSDGRLIAGGVVAVRRDWRSQRTGECGRAPQWSPFVCESETGPHPPAYVRCGGDANTGIDRSQEGSQENATRSCRRARARALG